MPEPRPLQKRRFRFAKRPGAAVIAVLLYALLFLAALYWMRGR